MYACVIYTHQLYVEIRFMEKKVSQLFLCGSQKSVIIAVFLVPQVHVQQPIIVIILIIYSSYF